MADKRGGIGEEIELTLGLSLNGRFGVDPIRTNDNNKLKRTYSAISTTRFELDTGPWLGGGEAIARTSSMPVNTEEEARKRKELQTIRRRQAKRRLTEKLRSVGGGSNGSGDYEKKADSEEVAKEERDDSLPPIVSQRSTGSSGLSEVESQTMPLHHGTNSPQSVQSFSEQKELRRETTNRDAKPQRSISAPNGMVMNMLADMPCVSTKGDGPNGKRVDGFLYRYKKGEEVRIVCVCHGSFLSPAEFVKHAGGGDVEHPSRHIYINPSPSL